MKILITGANGFVGKNLIANLKASSDYELYLFGRNNSMEELDKFTTDCDFVVHLAGVNRPDNINAFYQENSNFTQLLCDSLFKNGNKSTILFTSSSQVGLDNEYASSKKESEEILLSHSSINGSKVMIYRLQNVYGKWSKPNYNTVVATWCYNISRGIPVEISDSDKIIDLIYIDDVVCEFINSINGNTVIDGNFYSIDKAERTTLGDLLDLIYSFKNSRENFQTPNVSTNFSKKMYSTYLSFLPTDSFKYPLNSHSDDRGSFTEVLKTLNYGQISINISKSGITKGQHWHNTKNEKFLVVNGTGIIILRHIITNEIVEIKVSGKCLEVVDIPVGYTHKIVNLGEDDLVTLMWANEMFDSNNPDTFFEEV